jgi:hypothetical protein
VGEDTEQEKRMCWKMAKPRMYGMNKPYVPNSKADKKKINPFGKKRKGKK